ncbi:MAG: hypothetical protein IIA55_09180 [Gemmatimonadetes bacterium]|nr:hypothetical protein [Gemmatimonadota bacterium]
MIGILGLTVAGIAAATQLVTVAVDVTIDSGRAVVDARYRFQGPIDSVRLVLIKLRGQSVRMLSTEWTLRESAGLYEFGVAGAASSLPLHVRYEINGAVDRVPMFVPSIATAPGTSRVEIRVIGVGDFSVKDGFPRFSDDGRGGLVARPDNVPSLILLPRRGSLSINRLADAMVALLVAFGTAIWLARYWRRRTMSTSTSIPTPSPNRTP